MTISLMPQSEIAHEERPGFTRMLLVDTNIFKGAIGEVPLDDNVLITGTNAAGKTSVIQALPLGFGLSPQKLSRKAQDKTFFGHYLPRTTSYIAFEYRNRMGSKRSVIMHLAASEEKLVYRFVRSELFENMFVADEGQFVEFKDLANHLRDCGYQIASRQVTTQIEYQTIIQGLPIEGSRKSDVAQMQADYALTPARTPLRNVENVIFSMLKKDGSLRALEDMIAEQVLKGERRIRFGGKREDLASWPKRFRSYRDVMAQEQAVVRLGAKNRVLEDAQKRRKTALSEMKGLLVDLTKAAEEHRTRVSRVRRLETLVREWRSFLKDQWSRVDNLRALKENHTVTVGRLSKELDNLGAEWALERTVLTLDIDKTREDLNIKRDEAAKLDSRLRQYSDENIVVAAATRSADALLSALNDAERERNDLTQEIRLGVKDVARIFMAEPGSPPEQHLKMRMQEFSSVSESPEWLPAFEDWYEELHEQHRDTLRNDAHFHAEEFKNKYHVLKRIDERISEENRRLQRSLSQNNATDIVQEIRVIIDSGIRELEFLPALERISEMHEDWTRSGDDLPPDAFTEALSSLLEYWSGNDGITADLRQQIRLRGHVVENAIKREFHASTDLADISSNGVSYLILTTILVGFVNIVRGKKPIQMVWALDELGNIDSQNVRNLLRMLNENGINLVSATPNADMGVRERFAHRLRIVKDRTHGPRLMEIRGAAKPSHTLQWSAERQTEPQASLSTERMSAAMRLDEKGG